MDDILELQMVLELKALRAENDKLKEERESLYKVISDNDLEEELGIAKIMNPEEKICLDGITHLAEIFEKGMYDANDVKNFDLLHKNLRLIRNQAIDDSKKKVGKVDIGEALKIVEGYKNE